MSHDLCDAMMFSLDVQQEQPQTADAAREILRRYGGQPDGQGTVNFPDGSRAVWREDEGAFEIQDCP